MVRSCERRRRFRLLPHVRWVCDLLRRPLAGHRGRAPWQVDLRMPASPLMGDAALSISIDRFVELTRLALAAEDLKSTVLRCALGSC